MGTIKRTDLAKIKKEVLKNRKNWIRVGYSTCGIAAGAEAVIQAFREEIEKRALEVDVRQCGCVGMCYAEPLVEVQVEGMPKVFYGKVNRDAALKIVEKHICGKKLVNDLVYQTKINQ